MQRTAPPPPPPLQLLPQSQSNQRQTRRKKPTSQSKLIDLHRAVRQFIWTLFPVSACALVSLKMKMMTTERQVMITLVAALHYLHCRSVHTSTHTYYQCPLFCCCCVPYLHGQCNHSFASLEDSLRRLDSIPIAGGGCDGEGAAVAAVQRVDRPLFTLLFIALIGR